LGGDLPAESALALSLGVFASEDVDFNGLEIQ
jgi:hypothetical protein